MKTKLKITLTGILLTLQGISLLLAQVTIGSGDKPQNYSVLELVSPSSAPKGLRLPCLTTQERSDLNLGTLTGEAKTKAAGLLIYNTDDSVLEFWDGTNWVSAKTIEPWMVSAAGPDYEMATLNTQNIFHMGTITIGDKSVPNAAVALNVATNNKGILLPQVALKSPTDQVTVPNPPVGLMVYNLGTESTFKTVGYLYWSGTEWKLFNSSTSTSPSVTNINCSGATLSPANYTSGQLYEGVVKLPYAGGNGGYYTGGNSFTANGLTFTLQDGKLEVGAGELILRVEGIPTVNSPQETTIPINPTPETDPGIRIPFWSGSCQAKVGDQVTADIKSIAVMDYMRFGTDPDSGAAGFWVECKTPDGLYSLRAFLRHSKQDGTATATNNTQSVSSSSNNNVQIRNNTDATRTIMWNYYTSYGASMIEDSGGNLNVPSKIYGGGQGNTWTSNASTSSAGLAPWGNAGIYNASNNGPEYRRYTWIDTDNTTKVAYNATIMAGIDPGASQQDPTKLKVFIKIEQIVAL